MLGPASSRSLMSPMKGFSDRSRYPNLTEKPKWLELGEPLIGSILAIAKTTLEQSQLADFDLAQIPVLSVYHFASSLDTSIDANQKGRHSVAISLTRHCIEALTLIDVGLQDEAFALPLLDKWRDGKKNSGNLRQGLEKSIWPRYGTGLWDEPWGEFFGNLSRAVQPYAHCSRELLEWQFAVLNHSCGEAKFTVAVGAYDPLKASRITLLHVLVGWTLGRLLLENRSNPTVTAISRDICELGKALGSSKLLVKQKDWSLELLPNLLFKSGSDWRDE